MARQEAHWRGIQFVPFRRPARTPGLASETNNPALGKPAAIEDVHTMPAQGKLADTRRSRISTWRGRAATRAPEYAQSNIAMHGTGFVVAREKGWEW